MVLPSIRQTLARWAGASVHPALPTKSSTRAMSRYLHRELPRVKRWLGAA